VNPFPICNKDRIRCYTTEYYNWVRHTISVYIKCQGVQHTTSRRGGTGWLCRLQVNSEQVSLEISSEAGESLHQQGARSTKWLFLRWSSFRIRLPYLAYTFGNGKRLENVISWPRGMKPYDFIDLLYFFFGLDVNKRFKTSTLNDIIKTRY
jgi:hypothetical protein